MNQILTLISRHKYFLLTFNAAILLLTLGKLAFSPPKWTAQAQLIVLSNPNSLDTNLGTLGTLKSSKINLSDTHASLIAQKSILLSTPVIEKVYDSDLQKNVFTSLSNYQKLFKVAIANKSHILDLRVIADDPELASQRTLNWIETYQKRLNELRQNEHQSRVVLNREQIEDARVELERAEQKLAQLRKNSGLVDSDQQTKNLLKIIGDLTSLQKQAQAQAKAYQEQVAILSERLQLTPEQAISSLGLAENQEYQALKSKLFEVETNLAQLQDRFNTNEARVQNLLSTTTELKSELEQNLNQTGIEEIDQSNNAGGKSSLIQQLILLESEAQAHLTKAQQYEQQITEIKANLASIPENQAELANLQREKNIAEEIYQGIVDQAQQGNLNSFNSYPNVQLIDPPQTNLQPSSPNKKVIFASLLFASLLGSTAIIFLLENQNPLLEPKDLRTAKFDIVICIPRFKIPASPFDLPFSIQVEFEKLASAISNKPQQDKRLLITSAISQEGKTTTTIGLAQALAKLGFNVLMVDADYRQAGLTKKMGFEDKTNQHYPVVVDDQIDLLVATPQPENAAALVSQGFFEDKVIKATSFGKYDYILIDSSPVSLTSETLMMSSMIANTLFVIRPGMSQREVVQSSLNQLRHYGSNTLGLVVNDVQGNNAHISAVQNYYFSSSSNSLHQHHLASQKDNFNQNNQTNSLVLKNNSQTTNDNNNDRGDIIVK